MTHYVFFDMKGYCVYEKECIREREREKEREKERERESEKIILEGVSNSIKRFSILNIE